MCLRSLGQLIGATESLSSEHGGVVAAALASGREVGGTNAWRHGTLWLTAHAILLSCLAASQPILTIAAHPRLCTETGGAGSLLYICVTTCVARSKTRPWHDLNLKP